MSALEREAPTEIQRSGNPPVSVYARTPTDMRLMRECLKAWPGKRVKACYIGVATGEDFYSWYPVGWGLPVVVQWTVTDIRPDCVEYCTKFLPKAVIPMVNDFHDGLPPYDFIVAQHVWMPDATFNSDGLRTLFKSNPALLVARDHKQTFEELLEIVPSNYGIFRHRTPHDPLSTVTEGPIFLNLDIFQAPLNSAYIKLQHLGGAKWQ